MKRFSAEIPDPEPPSLSAMAPSMVRPYAALGVSMAVVSSAAILISLARAQGVPALSIAALRMGLAALVFLPVAVVRCRREVRSLAAGDVVKIVCAGILLALHFAFWISSFDYTSVMSSVVFVSTNPLFVALASVLLLKEKIGRATAIGIVVAVAGGAVVGLADVSQAGHGSLRGDLLSLAGAIAASGYLLLGRSVRRRVSLTLYVGIAYTTAALALMAAVAVTRAGLAGYPPQGYLWVALLALGPQLLGHTSYNWALKYVTATLVTITLLAEPIGATLLAIPILGQVPTPLRVGGGALILAGIFISARSEARRRIQGRNAG